MLILMADDDLDDCELVDAAFSEIEDRPELRFVEDGEELLEYLCGEGRYSEPETAPRPCLILLDLNMPKIDGREALAQIKADPGLRRIPIVVLTTSKAEEDVFRTYDLGVAGYITKPTTFAGLVAMSRGIDQYWHHTVAVSSNGAVFFPDGK